MSEDDGLIHAYRLDGRGGAQKLPDWDALPQSDKPDDAAGTWVHLHLDREPARQWLRGSSGLSPIAVEALLYEETRPRCTAMGDGLLINLRGVNLNPGADPEDMVSIRIYIDNNRIVTTRRRTLIAVEDLCVALEKGKGPADTTAFLVSLVTLLLDRMGPVISDLDDDVDALEDHALTAADASLRAELWQLRHRAIALRRYISPQREALSRLLSDRPDWINDHAVQRLMEVANRITRYVEDLDSGRERAAIVQDELTTRLSEKMNRNMYVLSVIAGIFLPLSFVVGLLGVNVAGIPGSSWHWSFAVLTAGLAVLSVIEYWLFKRLKWI